MCTGINKFFLFSRKFWRGYNTSFAFFYIRLLETKTNFCVLVYKRIK